MDDSRCLEKDSGLCINCRKLTFDPKKARKSPYSPRPDISNYRTILLDHVVEDDFPRLQKLRASINRGCQMCNLLKDVIWSHVRSSPELLGLANEAMAKDQRDPGCLNIGIRIELRECHPHLGRLHLGNDSEEWTPAYMSGCIVVGELRNDLRIDIRDEIFGM